MRVRGIPSIRSSVTNLIWKICLNFQEMPIWQKSLVWILVQSKFQMDNFAYFQMWQVTTTLKMKLFCNQSWKHWLEENKFEITVSLSKIIEWLSFLTKEVSFCDKPKNLQKMQKCLTRQKWNLVRSAACFCLNLHEKCHF